MAKSSKIAATSKTKADALSNPQKQTNSTNKLTGNNKRISPGKKRKPVAKAAGTKTTTKSTANTKAAPITPSTKLTAPLNHYPTFLLAHQLPNFNDTINKAKKSPYLYSAEKAKTEKLLVSLFLYQYKTWYKHHFSSIENPSPIPKPIGPFTLITEYSYSSNFDHDNISFAKKYILDALQLANIIPNDNHSFISSSIDITSVRKKGKVGGDIDNIPGDFITIHLVPQLDNLLNLIK